MIDFLAACLALFADIALAITDVPVFEFFVACLVMAVAAGLFYALLRAARR